ncbi:response regulator NasT [marine gamma proteobacterium HTCC2207]|jgi:response regulator NasT|uniref:Response regulator NasT n=1 Tax=gamma proteobacterium HTCC2207 TaxID=314287 RepID=Q1YUV0_9GAMM|nr:response regulator NasT [marine gamma proteobacterium HTCC2207] [gamma proteobacterium HTCC2207]MDB4427311.1 ANTAR domain-containing protein [Porticoccaceae bacterium]MDC3261209.1 ANTAR domain-containing protein [bacterium]MDB4580939.1 ANTAR domain-containing protein [Porticoccaceae bacterium]MDC0517361.1 ANTAR domain-containing protein [Porticoccaceae bacterium]
MSAATQNNIVRVMLVDDVPQRSVRVAEKLTGDGFDVIARLPSAAGLLFQIEQQKPDVILIDLQSPGRDMLESLSVINIHNPTPVVMFSEEEDPSYIEEAVDAGVTAYMVGGVEAERVKPVIDVAMAQFKSFQALRQALDSTRTQLESLSVIDRAKSLLMQQHSVSEDKAHKLLRTLSMDTNQSLPQAAESVIKILSQNKKNSGNHDN